MNHLKLSDGTIIAIEEGSGLFDIIHIADTEADALAVCAALTPANLKQVEFSGADPKEPTGFYADLVLGHAPTRETTEDGKVLVRICLREKTDLELRVSALEESVATHDGAIEDLGTAVSGLAEV